MDALDTLNVRREEGRVVNLVLKQDSGHFVADELRWLDLIVLLVKVIMLETARDYR